MITQLIRYLPVWRLLEREEYGSVLEVGSGATGLGKYTNKKFVGCDPGLTYLKFQGLIIASNMIPVMGSVEALPFVDKSFDAVVSIDMLEHLEGCVWEIAINEMCRVARERVIIAFPCDRKALYCDRKLFKYFNRRSLQTSLGQHLSHDYPTSKEVSDILHRYGYNFAAVGNENVYLHYFLMYMESYFILRHGLTIIANLIRWDKTKLTELSPKARFVRHILYPLKYVMKAFDISPTYRKVFIVQIK